MYALGVYSTVCTTTIGHSHITNQCLNTTRKAIALCTHTVVARGWQKPETRKSKHSYIAYTIRYRITEIQDTSPISRSVGTHKTRGATSHVDANIHYPQQDTPSKPSLHERDIWGERHGISRHTQEALFQRVSVLARIENATEIWLIQVPSWKATLLLEVFKLPHSFQHALLLCLVFSQSLHVRFSYTLGHLVGISGGRHL